MSRVQDLTQLLGSTDKPETESTAKPYVFKQESQDAHILQLLIEHGNTKTVAEYAAMCEKRRGEGTLSEQSFRQRVSIIADKVLSAPPISLSDEQIDSMMPKDWGAGGGGQGRRNSKPVDLSALASALASRFAK